MGVWTFIGAVIRFYGWFGDARGVYIIIFIGTMGFAATQLIVGILGIVVLSEATSTTARAANCAARDAARSSRSGLPSPRVLGGSWRRGGAGTRTGGGPSA